MTSSRTKRRPWTKPPCLLCISDLSMTIRRTTNPLIVTCLSCFLFFSFIKYLNHFPCINQASLTTPYIPSSYFLSNTPLCSLSYIHTKHVYLSRFLGFILQYCADGYYRISVYSHCSHSSEGFSAFKCTFGSLSMAFAKRYALCCHSIEQSKYATRLSGKHPQQVCDPSNLREHLVCTSFPSRLIGEGGS